MTEKNIFEYRVVAQDHREGKESGTGFDRLSQAENAMIPGAKIQKRSKRIITSEGPWEDYSA